jgi:hypothetical protein
MVLDHKGSIRRRAGALATLWGVFGFVLPAFTQPAQPPAQLRTDVRIAPLVGSTDARHHTETYKALIRSEFNIMTTRLIGQHGEMFNYLRSVSIAISEPLDFENQESINLYFRNTRRVLQLLLNGIVDDRGSGGTHPIVIRADVHHLPAGSPQPDTPASFVTITAPHSPTGSTSFARLHLCMLFFALAVQRPPNDGRTRSILMEVARDYLSDGERALGVPLLPASRAAIEQIRRLVLGSP